MADRMSNIAGLFKESRTRTIVLTTIIVLIIAIVVGFFTLRRPVKGVEAAAGLTTTPGGIQSVPFNAPNPEYARLQEKQNVQEAKAAEEVGGSAIPTIVRAEKNTGALPEESETSIGFTALSREQSDTGTFSPKEFTGTDSTGKRALENCPLIPAESVLGTPVYDKNGRLIGYAGSDGKVHDAAGNVVGTLGPDGIVRDANGNIIGQKSAAITGTPVYDEKGNIIAYVGADGNVRDTTGRILGTLGADGVLRDPTGKVIGRAAVPVYDANGKLLGFAGPDSKIRDAKGNVIGTIGPDGVARDMNGNIIGKAGAISPGTPVYDAKGNVIGTVGPDGKVRDANGNVIGTVGVDGQVRDAQGNILGNIAKPETAALQQMIKKTGAGVAGTPVYDAQGNIVGYVGADGKVRDAKGNIIGTVGSDGQVRDAQGNIIGSVAQQMTPEQIAAQNLEASYQRQQEILKDQRLTQQVQQKQQAMASQASQLLSAWTTFPLQQYSAGEKEDISNEEENGEGNNAAMGGGSAASQSTSNAAVFIKAGTIYYGIINTAINSDEPGPVMATIINGQFKGAKLLGSLTNQGQAVLITFNLMTLPQFSKSIPVNVVAIDQNTARTALSTKTDNHYLLRYGSLFAAAFAQGYAQAALQSGATTTTAVGPGGSAAQTQSPDLSPGNKFAVALGNVGTQFSTQMNSVYNTPPTVYVAAGVAVGMLFMGDVQMPTS